MAFKPAGTLLLPQHPSNHIAADPWAGLLEFSDAEPRRRSADKAADSTENLFALRPPRGALISPTRSSNSR